MIIDDFEGEVEGTRNAHVWMWVETGPIKFHLKPGKLVRWYEGGPHEEGYSHTFQSMVWTGLRLICQTNTDACDCDGRIQRHWTGQTDKLKYRQDDEDDDVWYPGDWEEVNSYQYDHEAVKAGY